MIDNFSFGVKVLPVNLMVINPDAGDRNKEGLKGRNQVGLSSLFSISSQIG
jgi:hypothetical protein